MPYIHLGGPLMAYDRVFALNHKLAQCMLELPHTYPVSRLGFACNAGWYAAPADTMQSHSRGLWLMLFVHIKHVCLL